MPPDLIRGWIPVRVEKTRQHKNIERNLDSIRWDCALMDSHLPCFPPQHRLLSRNAPVIPGQRAAVTARPSTKVLRGQRRRLSANAVCSSPGSAQAGPARPRPLAIAIAVPNAEG